MYAMIQAGSIGAPYIPVLGLAGSNLLDNRDDMRIEPDPFHPERRSVVARAYRPDVALLHGLKADREGNVFLGRLSNDVLLAEASRRVIVSVEQVVRRLDAAEMAEALPSILVDAVVEAPYGAHPAGCPGRYVADGEHIAEYLAAASGDDSFEEYLRRTVFDFDGHDSYIERFVPAAWRESVGHVAALSRPA